MLPNNENISELIVRLRSWVDNPHLRSLGYGCYGTKASSDIEQAISEINNLRLANAGFTLGPPTLNDEERGAVRRAIFRCNVNAMARRLAGMDELADEDRKDAETFSGLLANGPTHWMPMPPPPDEVK